MGVLQKAYAFVKKHWSTDDDVFPDDLNRYEDGIEDLYSRATEQDKQINVLSSLQNGFKLYKDFAEIGDSINNNTPLQTLIETMQDCSILICNSNGGTAYKGLFGTLIVHKRDNWHADLKLTVDSGKTYTAYYNKDNGVGLRDFEEIATTSKTDILCTLKPNFTKEYDDSHKVNNVYYLDFSCTKSTPLSVGKNDVCTVPFSVGNKRFPVKVLYATDNNVVLGVGEGFLYYSTLEVYPKIVNVSKIYVSGAVSL